MTTFRIVRDHMTNEPTTGQLYAPPDLTMFTLEDPWINNAPMISCIPVGTYRVILSMSNRFRRVMPELLNVPERAGIRIHGGNTQFDTEGCILVGMSQVNKWTLGNSQLALGYFTDWFEDALSKGPVFCEVSDGSQA